MRGGGGTNVGLLRGAICIVSTWETEIYCSVHCPLVLLVKVGWKPGKAFGSEESKVIGSDSWQYGAEGRSWALGVSFVFGGQQYDETVQFCVWRAAV
jgi:hypothetical protein